MDAKRYRQVRQLFDAVLEQAPEHRSAYLSEAGDGDTALREEVRHLLDASDARTGIFETPPIVHDGPGPLQRWEGRRLGPYRILRELGEGGMGIVYLARRADGAFQKEVAIKIVRRQLATPQFFQRFQREREILARLEHPNIARLLDGGADPPFLVMEYIKGEPLLAFADSRKLSYDARLGLLRQVASAVDYAHRQGVVHRDLKPPNIFVTADGEVKLLDFGIAAWQQDRPESELSPTIAMSPLYASPEQVRGDKTNSMTDIYSLGLVAYELLAGMPAFHLEEAALKEVLRTVLEETPVPPSTAVRQSKTPSPADLSRRRQMAPIELIQRLERADSPLLRALSKHREERPASAGALIAELDVAAAERKTIPRWLESLARLWGFLALQAGFLGFVVAGEIRMSAMAWSAYVWTSAMALLLRLGVLPRLFALSRTAVIVTGLVTFVFGIGLAAGTRQEFARKVTLGLVVVVGFLVFDVAHYYLRRSSTLGVLWLGAKGKNWGPGWAVLFAAAAGWFAVSSLRSEAQTMIATTLYVLGFWLCWKISLKPLEVREKGIVVPSALLPWSSIKSYAWLDSTHLEFRLHSTVLRPVSYLRAQVSPEVRDRVQELLQAWLLEDLARD